MENSTLFYIFFTLSLRLQSHFLLSGEKHWTCPELEEKRDNRRLEVKASSVSILNSLEQLGYRVVTSGSFTPAMVMSVWMLMLDVREFSRLVE